ncbi:PREDICTED: cytochrome P450 CYP12A2 isoform X1 [Nicrophorus vespilloides]|uniref:Cytochrome P450 CYP12A2 isoform X1 n=1 Tax=Nicrophorus vespilloides TaxID=110193 RepID=A0ABM1M3Q5_NICVS|nr:PREDICTED: cytochrome P450 CYP12A2 isoform X1 [Nicrophorus vespilloides]XP_017769205.1 PREDICTED: cytochrome P450 CYP12A2 isoform X1 [Nicrophorus vespilloides]XP_017769206.1 PREDICTED: cytochrome P450 CYP12A2 isoform X1 [Nicrophorus vespilloides]
MIPRTMLNFQIRRSIATSHLNSRSSVEAIETKATYYQEQIDKYQDDEKPSNWNESKPYNSIPGPKPWPIVGNIWRFFYGEFKGKNMAEISKHLRNTYGDIVVLNKLIGIPDKVFLYNAEDIEKMHRNEGLWPQRDALHSILYYRTVLRKDIFQDKPGLTAMQGQDWFKFRTVVNPILMQPRTTIKYVGQMDTIADDFLRQIHRLYEINPEMPEDFELLINKWTLESITFLAIDKRIGCLEDHPTEEIQTFLASTVGVFKQMYKLDVLPSLWKVYSTKDWKLFVKHMDFITNTLLKYVDEAFQSVKDNPEIKDKFNKSIFDKFLELDRKVAITMAIDMMTGGIDTTSKTFAATLYFLSTNQGPQTKLREELKMLMPNKNTPITAEILEKAKYLKAAIKESTRLAPIAVGNMRKTQKALVLSGYQIPKGVDLLSGAIALHHDDKQFKDSKKYMPERFLRTTTCEYSVKNTNPFVFLPFGFGSRSCVGKRLANLELEIALAKIVRNYYLDWKRPEMKFNTTLIYGTADPLRYHLRAVED